MNISETEFINLAINNPKELVRLVSSNTLENAYLTYAAEAFAHCTDSLLVRRTLIPLLRHDSAYVRQGVILGLFDHVNKKALEIIADLSINDSDEGVRKLAANVMESFTSRNNKPKPGSIVFGKWRKVDEPVLLRICKRGCCCVLVEDSSDLGSLALPYYWEEVNEN